MTRYPRLTPRELDVLAFLTEGKTTREMAAELNVSPATVKAHLGSLFTKLDVTNRTEAAMVGLGMIPLLRSRLGRRAISRSTP